MTTENISIDKITVDDSLQVRDDIDYAVVVEYRLLMREGTMPPGAVAQVHWLRDFGDSEHLIENWPEVIERVSEIAELLDEYVVWGRVFNLGRKPKPPSGP